MPSEDHQDRTDQTMKCHDCGRDHDDWTKQGEYAAGPNSPAIVVVWECEKCGATEEVERL